MREARPTHRRRRAANAVLLCVLPAAAKAGRRYLYAAFCLMGCFQGPLIPAQGAIKAEWLKVPTHSSRMYPGCAADAGL